MLCDWVQGTILEIMEQHQWASHFHTWHNWPTWTWVVSDLIGLWCCDVVIGCDCCYWVQVTVLELLEQHHWASHCHAWLNWPTWAWVVSDLVDCDVVIGCDWLLLSTGNGIGADGATSLSQSLSHLTQLTNLDLSCEWFGWMWCCNCCDVVLLWLVVIGYR